MSVDVIYQGLPIARGAAFRVEAGGLFIEMEGPMPVATALTLAYEQNRLEGRVLRIHEGVGAGVLFAPTGPMPAWIKSVRPSVAPTVEFEAEPEQAPISSAAPPPPPLAAMAEQLPFAQAAPVPVKSPEAVEPSSAVTPVAVEPAPGDQAGEPSAPAALPPPIQSAAPSEATQEMTIPSLEDELKLDEGGDPAGADRRPAKKKKNSRKR